LQHFLRLLDQAIVVSNELPEDLDNNSVDICICNLGQTEVSGNLDTEGNVHSNNDNLGEFDVDQVENFRSSNIDIGSVAEDFVDLGIDISQDLVDGGIDGSLDSIDCREVEKDKSGTDQYMGALPLLLLLLSAPLLLFILDKQASNENPVHCSAGHYFTFNVNVNVDRE